MRSRLSTARRASWGPLLDMLDKLGLSIDVNAPLDRTDAAGDAYRSQYPLLWVCEEGNAELESVQALVERGADINVRDDATGWTPLMWACSGAFEGYWDAYKGDDAARLAQTEEAIDYLLDMGADPGNRKCGGRHGVVSFLRSTWGTRTIGDLSEDAAAEALSTYESRLNP